MYARLMTKYVYRNVRGLAYADAKTLWHSSAVPTET